MFAKRKTSLAACILAAATLAGATAPANAATGPSSAPAESYAGACALLTSVKITFDGDPKQYMLDETTGALETYKEPTLQDCKDEVQATGGPASGKAGTATTQASGVRVDLGKKDFSSGNRFFEKSDTNGRFTAQYGFGKGNPVAFGFDPSAFLEGIATGPASAVATRLPGDCRYSKTQNLNYGWHWSCLNHEPSRLYRMDGDWKFDAKVGGRAAKAEVIWRFNYTVRLV